MGNVVLAIVWFAGLLIAIAATALLIGLALYATGAFSGSRDE